MSSGIRTAARTYWISVDGKETAYPTAEAQFAAYVAAEKKLLKGEVEELFAFDAVHQYGRMDYFAVTIYTEGEPEGWRY